VKFFGSYTHRVSKFKSCLTENRIAWPWRWRRYHQFKRR